MVPHVGSFAVSDESGGKDGGKRQLALMGNKGLRVKVAASRDRR